MEICANNPKSESIQVFRVMYMKKSGNKGEAYEEPLRSSVNK